MADDLSLTLAGISKAVSELNKPYWDDRQIKIGKTLFNWWHAVDLENELHPRWEACTTHIQAFWMDGAWRVMRG